MNLQTLLMNTDASLSPARRGRMFGRALNRLDRPVLARDGLRFSLSQRERAGVREDTTFSATALDFARVFKTKLPNALLLSLAIFISSITIAYSAETAFILPPETAKLKPAPDAALATGKCLVCHSVDYVAMQPPFSETVWRATVLKMRDRFGAPIATNEVEHLVRYFTENYGVKAAK